MDDIWTQLGQVNWGGAILQMVIVILVFTVVLVGAGYETYFERKAIARAQQRLGPNQTGPVGMLQWVADALKMVTKEPSVPAGADVPVFMGAPIVIALAATAVWAFIPFSQVGNFEIFGQRVGFLVGDTPIGLLGILAFSSIGVYGVIMAGWGSNNKYALLGSLRASAQVISYEIVLGISLLGVMMLSQSFNLNAIARAQGLGAALGTGFNPDVLSSVGTASQPGLWFILLQPLAFLIFVIAATAESNRIPFDLPEAEGELVAGYHVEYGAMNFGAFMLSEFIAVLTMSALFSLCFFGGWQSPIPVLSGGLWEPFWFVLKILFGIFFFFSLRFTLPRLRYDQVMGVTWKVLLPLVLLNIVVVTIMKGLMLYVFNNPPPFSFGNLGQSWPWLLFVAVEMVFFLVAIFGLSRITAQSPTGRSERPLLIKNPTPATMLQTPAGLVGSERSITVARKG